MDPFLKTPPEGIINSEYLKTLMEVKTLANKCVIDASE